jgi:uncharacterized membrane protein
MAVDSNGVNGLKGVTLSHALLALGFTAAGVLHLIAPERYLGIVPPADTAAGAIVLVSGIAEIVGGAGILVGRYRHWAGIGLMALLVAVFPANVEMLRQGYARGAAAPVLALLWSRLPLQPLMIWWVWASCVRAPRGKATAQPV